MKSPEPAAHLPKPTTGEKLISFSTEDERFFAGDETTNPLLRERREQSVADDVVGRALTSEELAAVQREVQKEAEARKSEVRKFFERYGKSVMQTLSLVLGFSATSPDLPTPPPAEPKQEVTPADTQEIAKRVAMQEAEQDLGEDFLQLAEMNFAAYQGTPEYYGRSGRPEWTPAERLNYSKLPTEAKLYALHPEVASYTDQEFLTHLDELLEIARSEFKHTDLRQQLATGAIERFARLAPAMEAQPSIDTYDHLMSALGDELGLRYTTTLRLELDQVLDANHPLKQLIANSHLAEDELLLDKSQRKTAKGQFIQRSMEFDQDKGVVNAWAQVGSESVLLASYAGNGGDPRFSATGKATREFAATRAGDFRVRQLETGHVSPNWKGSFIPQDAPIKQVGDDFLYQGADGTFHYATGPKAEFFGLTPFDGRVTAAERELLLSAGDQVKVRKDDTEGISAVKNQGGRFVGVSGDSKRYVIPATPFSIADFQDTSGQTITQWGKNDFGPKTLVYETLGGERQQQMFHSSYLELQGKGFLDTSHGCIHMYQEELQDLFALVKPGDQIHITPIERKFRSEEETVAVHGPSTTNDG